MKNITDCAFLRRNEVVGSVFVKHDDDRFKGQQAFIPESPVPLRDFASLPPGPAQPIDFQPQPGATSRIDVELM